MTVSFETGEERPPPLDSFELIARVKLNFLGGVAAGRDYLCGNPNRVEIRKVGETAPGGITQRQPFVLLPYPRPRPFSLYSYMFTYENDAPQVDTQRATLFSPRRVPPDYSCFRSRISIHVPLSVSLSLPFPLSLSLSLSHFGYDNGIPHAHTFVTTVLLRPEIIRTVNLCKVTGRANCSAANQISGDRRN